MDSIILSFFIIFGVILVVCGVGFLIYFFIKKLGHPKTAIYLTIFYGLILVLYIPFSIIFEDKFFSPSDAKSLIEEQGIELVDSFTIIENKSQSAIGDYYHTFTLGISVRDKDNAISQINNANNYIGEILSFDNLPFTNPNPYFGSKIVRNYQTKYSYVREYFEPSGREGFAPTFRRISIIKTRNELVYEDIVE